MLWSELYGVCLMPLSLPGRPNPPSGLAKARASSGGLIFRETFELPAGRQSARMQILFSAFARDDRVTMIARHGENSLAQSSLSSDDPDALSKADSTYLTFDLASIAPVTFEAWASANAASTHLRQFTLAAGDPDPANFAFYPPNYPARPVMSVVLGTTAVCNANCSHCPTNKAYSRTQAKGVMSPALFEKIITGLAEIGYDRTIMFGLFGDPLQDPLFADRVAFIRRACPQASIAISTNGALYDSAKHQAALAQVDSISVHIEAMTPDVYETHMRPLKVHRTFPRTERILADNPRRVHIVSPVHKDNLDQLASLKFHWEGLGANETEFVPLSNRSGKSPNFEALALAPCAVGCGPTMVETELIIDWDGTVLTCCQDFHRLSKIGDMTRETVSETLINVERARVRELMNQKQWGRLSACAGCKIDAQDVVQEMITERLGQIGRFSFGPIQFRIEGSGIACSDGIRITTRHPWVAMGRILNGRRNRRFCTIFGPYRRLPAGRYAVHFDLKDLQTGPGTDLTLQVVDGQTILTQCRFRDVAAPPELSLMVEISGTEKLEFRTRARGLDALFTGVRVERLGPVGTRVGASSDLGAEAGETARVTDLRPIGPGSRLC